MNIAVVDYGMGNLRSVSKALEHVAPKARVMVTADPKT
ncbi:MAG TPA: imidazole glycerol phosphate synthase subunit HisH, partial [Burkholderiales bacterium]|nr:imidazole glycerol phosphate synthase subunit HisH [Burkholderiales bacterium]